MEGLDGTVGAALRDVLGLEGRDGLGGTAREPGPDADCLGGRFGGAATELAEAKGIGNEDTEWTVAIRGGEANGSLSSSNGF